MFGLGSQELFLILLIGLVLFGGSKLPDLARSMGRSMSEFRKGMREPADEPEKPAKGPGAEG